MALVQQGVDKTASQPLAWSYQPLQPEQVRWYWFKSPIAKDSLACESYYKQHQAEVERAWWQQQATFCKKAPTTSATEGERVPSEDTWEDFFVEEVYSGLPTVKRGQWEVDVAARRMQCCYWPGPRHTVLRGSWFVERTNGEWLPLRENLADQLEETYKGGVWNPKFKHVAPQPQGITAARIELLTSSSKGLFALFAGPDEAYLCTDDGLGWLRKMAGSGVAKLRRGYVAPASPAALAAEADIKAEEVDQAAAGGAVAGLVLFVHGIGQQLAAANIVTDCLNFAQVLHSTSGECLSTDIKGRGRIECLPVQWRRQLNLEVDRLAALIQPTNVHALRQMAHATVVEVLLYMSPVTRQRILDSLTDALNVMYHRFVHRNPGFQGSVCVVGHSLGSVLLNDILCHQPQLFASLAPPPPPPPPPPSPTPATTPPNPPTGTATEGCATQRDCGDVAMEQAVTDNEAMTDMEEGGEEEAVLAEEQAPAMQHAQGGGEPGPACGEEGPPPGPPQHPCADDAVAGSGLDGNQGELTDLQARNRELTAQLEALRADRDAMTARLGAETAPPSSSGGEHDVAAQLGLQARIRVKTLAFAVDAFIMLGSPMALFHTLRGVDPEAGRALGSPQAAALLPGPSCTPDGLPACRRLYNLYHPFDPVAYRMEPLLDVHMASHRACLVPHKGGTRTHIALQEFGEGVTAVAGRWSATLMASMSLNRISTKRIEGGGEPPALPAPEAGAAEGGDADESAPPVSARSCPASPTPIGEVVGKSPKLRNPAGPSSGPSALHRLTDGYAAYVHPRRQQGRLDFALQEAITENAYLSALSAHFAYWVSPDVALFVLRATLGLPVLARWADERLEEEAREREAAKKASAVDDKAPKRPALEEPPRGEGQQRTASAEALDELRRQAPESVALTKDVVAFLQS